MTAARAEAGFQLGSGRGEDLDVVVELPVGVAGLVDEPEAVRAIALEQTHDGRLNSRTWRALRPEPHRVTRCDRSPADRGLRDSRPRSGAKELPQIAALYLR